MGKPVIWWYTNPDGSVVAKSFDFPQWRYWSCTVDKDGATASLKAHIAELDFTHYEPLPTPERRAA